MRKRLHESIQLRLQDEENRKELISNISHDLRTPITNIKGYIEGIRDGVADTPEKMDKYVNIIYTKTIDLDRLVDELFLYSKLDLKQVPFMYEHVDIIGFIDDCIDERATCWRRRTFCWSGKIAPVILSRSLPTWKN